MGNSFSLDELSSLLTLLERSNVTEFELEKEGEKLRLKRGVVVVSQMAPYDAHSGNEQEFPGNVERIPVGLSRDENGKSEAVLSLVKGAKEKSTHEVRSPMVGTFYRRPSPDAKPFADVGELVKKGDVLCIVEAMKLMNEIESDISGRVVEVCLDDSQMVEYGEVLFRIDPAAST